MYGGLAAKSCQSLTTPWTVALCNQSPLSMGFPRQEYWSELPFPSPGDLPDPGMEPASPALQADSLLLSHQGSLLNHHIVYLKYMQFLFMQLYLSKAEKGKYNTTNSCRTSPQLYQLLPFGPFYFITLSVYTHIHTHIHMCTSAHRYFITACIVSSDQFENTLQLSFLCIS